MQQQIVSDNRAAKADPMKQLACGVIWAALEDLTLQGTDLQLDARRFLFGRSEENRRARAFWFERAGLTMDAVARLKNEKPRVIGERLRRPAARQQGRASAIRTANK